MKEKTNQSLVNTSLPAKEAPALKPATLASLTVKSDISATTAAFSNMRFEKKAAYQPLTKSSLANSSLTKPSPFTSDDFPSLGSKKPSTANAVKANTTNYAALSRDWAKKQEEDKIVAKEEAEKEQHRQQAQPHGAWLLQWTCSSLSHSADDSDAIHGRRRSKGLSRQLSCC